MNQNRSNFSLADFFALACAIAMGIAFLFMPWLNLFGVSSTGLRLLSDVQSTIQNDVSILFLILVAAVGGGLFALWGMFDPYRRRTASIFTLLAGLVGLVYYANFFYQNSQSPVDATGIVGAGFWVALFSSIGLVLQVLLPRSMASTPTSSTSPVAPNLSSYEETHILSPYNSTTTPPSV